MSEVDVWAYVLNSLAWSGLGLAAGAALTQIGIDVRSLVSGRWHHDDHE